jgi:folate-dependent phosphoribosylglycinamide formyltransferase PurN
MRLDKDTKWLALFSMTGSEIAKLTRELGRGPDSIITDNVDEKDYTIHDDIKDLQCLIKQSFKTNAKDKVKLYEKFLEGYDLITLHGWLNIVPPAICKKYSILNGHPGLITRYEDLKGKDPQFKAWTRLKRYEYMGSVVHKVVPEVDSGEIVAVAEVPVVEGKSLDDVYGILANTSKLAWINALT